MILRERMPLHIPRMVCLMIGLLTAGTLPAWSQQVAPEPEQQIRTAPILPPGAESGGVGYAAENPLPADAQKLIAESAQQEAEIRGELEKKLAAQREQLIAQLRELQDRYTKAGQLDEAVAIRDHIRQLSGVVARFPHGMGLITIPSGYRGGPGRLQPMADAVQFRGEIGRQIPLIVTGSTDGQVWGNGVYSDDSTIATAAVHAGILQPGQRGLILLTVHHGKDHYDGTTSNGVASMSYGPWPGSYSLSSVPSPVLRNYTTPPQPQNGPGPQREGAAPNLQNWIPSTTSSAPYDGSYLIEPSTTTNQPRTYNPFGQRQLTGPDEADHEGPPSLDVLRDDAAAASKAGHPLVLERLVTGTTSGTVWGTDIYTDDSAIEAAAVHAGVLRDGEQGWVRITLMPDIGKYSGSTRNGVASQDWGIWGGCFRIERGGPPQGATGAGIAPGTGGPNTPQPLPPATDVPGAPGLAPSVPGAIPVRPELTPPATVEPGGPGALPPNSGPPAGGAAPATDEPRSSGPAPSVLGGLPGASAPPAVKE